MASRFRPNRTFAHSIDSAGWASFFMWVGIALLAGFSWTVSLIGTAAIILSVQAVLFLRGERLDVFMGAVGLVLFIGAFADVYGSIWSLFPALLIVIGIAMLADTLRRGPGENIEINDEAGGSRPI
jgi:membrane-bound ClpP family serine protease